MNQVELYINLCESIKRHDSDGVRRWLQEGARPDDNGTGHWPALHIAAEQGFVEGLEALLQAGADVNSRGLFQYTPLMVASTHNSIEAGRFLIRRSAQTDVLSLLGETALYIALDRSHMEFAQMVIRDAHQSRKTMLDATARKAADTPGGSEVAHWLIDQGASPDLVLENGKPWLVSAQSMLSRFSEPMTELLLKAGARVDAPSSTGDTALHEAARRQTLKPFMMLLRFGANPDLQNQTGETPRMLVRDGESEELRSALMAWETSSTAHRIINTPPAAPGIQPL